MIDQFEQIAIGATTELTHRVSAEDVQKFCDLTGDDNPVHMDDQFAHTLGFGKRVVHGMLTASFLSTLIGTKLPGKGALWYEQNLRFLRPVRVGESITVRATVTQKSPAQRIVVMSTIICNAQGDRVVEGEGKVKLLKPRFNQGSAMDTEKQKAVIVTGASRGIGAAIATALAQAGHPVLINCASSLPEAEEVAEAIVQAGGRAMVFQADVCHADQVTEMVCAAEEAFGPLAGAVHNASATLTPVPMGELSWSLMQRHLEVQLQGAFHLFGALLPRLERSGAGLLVSIGSTMTDHVPPPHFAHYVAAKSALLAYTKCIAAEYGPKGVRAVSVSPGMTQTALIADLPEKAKILAKMQTPLRRIGMPEDVAGLVTFLFNPAAAYITGQNIRVCGGSVMM